MLGKKRMMVLIKWMVVVRVVDSTVAVVGELLGADSTNQSFDDPSLAAIKPTPLRGNGLIWKATGTPPYVMLLASMQKVMDTQHSFLLKMKQVINEEFDKREVGHRNFQVLRARYAGFI